MIRWTWRVWVSSLVGWALGVALALFIVLTWDFGGIWGFVLGFGCGFLGYAVGNGVGQRWEGRS